MRTLVLVLSALQRPYPDLIRAQKRTWAARDLADVDVLFYYGGAETLRHGRDLFVAAPDTYWEIGHKTLACFEYVLQTLEFDLVFRTNCSSYVDLPNLRAWVSEHAVASRFYAGVLGFHPPAGDVYASGSGYFLSRDLVERVVQERASWDHGLHDDVALGKLLARAGVTPAPTPRVDVPDVREARRIDTSHFHFRCKTDSSWRRGDIDVLLEIDRAFAKARGEEHERWYTPKRRLKTLARRLQRSLARPARVEAVPTWPARRDQALARALGRPPADDAFITGNGFAAHCRYVLNYEDLAVNEGADNNWWFCKSDFLASFFRELAPDDDFVLFSHNSDLEIGDAFSRDLGRPELVAWFGANVALRHPKLFALPLGIANPHWPHGDTDVLRRAQAAPAEKTRLFDTSFDPATNPAERARCLRETGLAAESRKPFADYVSALRTSYFALSPRGNGIDCHRTWEALYLGSVPVVTRSVLTEQHPELPMVVLEDWSEFSSIDFSPELYERTWGDWSPEAIRLDRYLARVEGLISSRVSRAGERSGAASPRE